MARTFMHSKKSLEVLHSFYKKDFIVWVEGDDDFLYWSYALDSFGIKGYYIKKAYGKNELAKYIEKIIEEDTKIIVASDIDYDELLNIIVRHDRVIYTYGYSIENSMYCPCSIANNIEKYGKSKFNDISVIEKWYSKFCNEIKPLVIYDIANEKYKKSIKVMGDSSNAFLKNPNSVELSQEKIGKKISYIKDNFSYEEIAATTQDVDTYKKELRYIIKGHFLTDVIRNLIKKHAVKSEKSKFSLSNHSLFSNTIDGCKLCNTMKCYDKEYLLTQINIAVSSLA